jgi:hypothetical protein
VHPTAMKTIISTRTNFRVTRGTSGNRMARMMTVRCIATTTTSETDIAEENTRIRGSTKPKVSNVCSVPMKIKVVTTTTSRRMKTTRTKKVKEDAADDSKMQTKLERIIKPRISEKLQCRPERENSPVISQTQEESDDAEDDGIGRKDRNEASPNGAPDKEG